MNEEVSACMQQSALGCFLYLDPIPSLLPPSSPSLEPCS